MDWSSREHCRCDGSHGLWTRRGWRKGKEQWEELSVICLWLAAILHVTKHPAGPKGLGLTVSSLHLYQLPNSESPRELRLPVGRAQRTKG